MRRVPTAGRGHGVQANLLVELFLYLLALVPRENTQQPLLRWRKKEQPGDVWRGQGQPLCTQPQPPPWACRPGVPAGRLAPH